MEMPFYLPWAGMCCLPALSSHTKDRRQRVHPSWGGTEAISQSSVAKGHALIFPSCLWPTLLLLSSNNPMNHTAAGAALFVILLRKGRKAAEISAQIQHCPALVSSGKALSLGWQMPGTGRSAEISVYLIFFPPIHPGFFAALCSQNAKAANQCSVTPVNWAVWEKGSTGRRNHTYLLLWTVLSYSLSLLAGAPKHPSVSQGCSVFITIPRISRRGHKCFVLWPCLSNTSKHREGTKRHIVVSPSLWEGESNFTWRKHHLKALMALLSPMPSCSSLPLSAWIVFSPPQDEEGVSGADAQHPSPPSQETRERKRLVWRCETLEGKGVGLAKPGGLCSSWRMSKTHIVN